MKKLLILSLAAGLGACSDSATQPAASTVEAMMVSAPDWTAAEIVGTLPVDEATRAQIEKELGALQASLLELRRRHEAISTLEGDERDEHLAELHGDAKSLHEQHSVLWDGLDPGVKDALRARLHEHASGGHDGDGNRSLHERMRQLHGGH